MELNKTYQDIECIDLNTDFQGIAFIDNKKVFIENFLPDEIADVKVTTIKSKFAKGEVKTFKQKSPMREGSLQSEQPYAYFGGCDLQTLNYDSQLKIKKQLTEKTAKLQDRNTQYVFDAVEASPKQTHYRNKIHYQLYFDPFDAVIKAGFFLKGTKKLVEVKENILADEKIVKILPKVLLKLNEHQIKIANIKEQVQGLKAVMFRWSETKKQMMVIFVATTKNIKKIERVAKELVRENNVIKSVYLNINGKNQGSILGRQMLLLAGKEAIQDELLGMNFNIPATAFYQVNAPQTAKIYQHVLDIIAADKKATVIDFYCGIGTMTNLIAPQVHKAIGIDIVEESINAAKQNAIINNIANSEFVAEDVNTFIQEYKKVDASLIAIIDPPRSGCTPEFIEKLTELNPDKVIYISCNPKTLITDLKAFNERGFEHEEIKLYDMFPQTLHVESVVLLSRVQK